MYGKFIAPSDDEIDRMALGVKKSLESPIVGDVQGYVWEKVFAYGRSIHDVNPSKKLFDVVSADGRGWSCKTIESNCSQKDQRVEYVIARADVYSKGVQLGFRGGLTQNSPPSALGDALVEHYNRKFRADSKAQKVTYPFIAVLIKSRDRQRFTYVEAEYPEWDPTGIDWTWSEPKNGRSHVGLTGTRDGRPVLRWHPSGAQLFEVLTLPEEARTFNVTWEREDLSDFFES